MITYNYTQNGGNYFFTVFKDKTEVFGGAGYYEQMLESVAHCKKLFEPENFKGAFHFASSALKAVHDLQPYTMGSRKNIGASGAVSCDYFKINSEYYSYIVSHGNGYFTFNEWEAGQLVPKMMDLSKDEFNMFKTLGLI